MNELVQTENYDSLAEEVNAILVEAVFNSRQDLIKGYWEVGQAIRRFKKGQVTELLQDLAVDLNKSERMLWYAVEFYDTFPSFSQVELLEEGKNLSMNKIITKYLGGEPKKKTEHEYQCPRCYFKGKLVEFEL